VIMSSMCTDPWIWTSFVGRGRVLLYQFDPPSTQPWSIVKRFAQRTERRRRANGGGVRIAVNNRRSLDAWQRVASWLDPVQLPFTGSHTVAPAPDARDRLGLGPSARIALLFGSPHRYKDAATVWEAFERLPDWSLVVAGGGAADDHRDWRDQHPDATLKPVLVEGYVSESTRRLLYAAADLVVLSFTAGNEQDSGTLNDAISSGTPVVVSAPGFAADAVEALEFGTVFEAGDPDSLVDAVRSSPTMLAPDVVAAAQDRTSARQVARDHLAALESGRFVSETKRPVTGRGSRDRRRRS
jgi:glycosyltransferase involved in cell wall biosynthesis